MGATPWKTDKWYTSPWNHDPDVTDGLQPAEKIVIHDVTLRDGEQQARVEFNADDKVRIAEALVDAGIQRIEAGLPAVSPSDMEAVRRIVGLGLPADIYAFSRCMVDDVQKAIDCGVKGVVMRCPRVGTSLNSGIGGASSVQSSCQSRQPISRMRTDFWCPSSPSTPLGQASTTTST